MKLLRRAAHVNGTAQSVEPFLRKFWLPEATAQKIVELSGSVNIVFWQAYRLEEVH